MDILGGPKHYLRKYSPGRAVNSIRELVVKYRPEFLEFIDEMFMKDSKWMNTFCAAYKKEIGLPFSINVRIDVCSERTIEMLADCGLRVVFFGLECGDEEYRRSYLNRHMGNDEILKGAAILRKHGILIVTYNMFGMPFENPDMLQKTFELNRELQPDAVGAFIYQPLPGTKLGRLAYDNNLVQPPPPDHWDYLAPSLDSRELPAAYVEEQVTLFREEFDAPERMHSLNRKLFKFVGREQA